MRCAVPSGVATCSRASAKPAAVPYKLPLGFSSEQVFLRNFLQSVLDRQCRILPAQQKSATPMRCSACHKINSLACRKER